MLKHCHAMALLALTGQAGAHVVSTMPITLPEGCPGVSQPLYTVIPQLTTKNDDLGVALGTTLIVKDWGSPTGSINTLNVCAFAPDGGFLGGSVVRYSHGSRLLMHQTTGTDGLSLEKIVKATTPDLKDREFQLYVGIGGSNNPRESQMEFGQTGNGGQYVVSASVPRRTLRFTAMLDGDSTPFTTTYFVANPGPACSLKVNFLTDDGQQLATSLPDVPAYGRVALDPEHSKGLPYSSVVVEKGTCGDIFAMRLISFPSDALGGRSAIMTTSRYYE